MAVDMKSAGGGTASGGAGQSGSLGAPAGVSAALAALPPLPLRAEHLTLGELIDLYFAHYAGRDKAIVQRLMWWSVRLGKLRLDELSDDHIHEALETLASQKSRFFSGYDAGGMPIYKARKRPITPATVNRYQAAIGALVTWAIKKRIAAKGFVHPCRTVERRPENNERVRFLSDSERERVLQACERSRWPRLILLVLMALTTGARKGELLALRWDHIDFDRNLAHCGLTKNGDPRALPLVPEVMRLLGQFRASPGSLVFASKRRPGQAFDPKSPWLKALHDAKVRDFRFHDLRHSCASMLAQDGATLLEIADVLGHRQLQMTKRYSHLTTGHKAALVNRVWGNINAIK